MLVARLVVEGLRLDLGQADAAVEARVARGRALGRHAQLLDDDALAPVEEVKTLGDLGHGPRGGVGQVE